MKFSRNLIVFFSLWAGILACPDFSGAVSFHANSLRLNTAVKSLQEIRNSGIVRQRWDYSCGSAALSTVLTHHLGDPTPESAVVVSILRRSDPVRVRSRGGFSLLNLKHYLERRGYDGTGYADLTLSDLEQFDIPPILPVHIKGYDHFVVFRGRYGNRVVLADPAFGNLTMSVARFQEIWKNGIGFVVSNIQLKDTTEASFDKSDLPFVNLPATQRFVSNGASFSTGRKH